MIAICVGGAFSLLILAIAIFVYIYKRREQRFNKLWRILKEMNLSEEKMSELKTKSDEFYVHPNSIFIDFSKLLGEGVCSKVYVGHLLGTSPLYNLTRKIEVQRFQDCSVAVKVASNFGQDEVSSLLNEIGTMKTLGYHENVMCMLGWTLAADMPCLIFDLANGDLLDFVQGLRACLETEIPHKTFISMLWQIARGRWGQMGFYGFPPSCQKKSWS